MAECGRIFFLTWLIQNVIKTDLPPTAALLPDFGTTINKFENAQGDWIRNPVQWNDPKDVSRDQLDPTIMNLAIRRIDHYVTSELWKLIRRFFRYPNGDLCSPEHLSHFLRANPKNKYFKPLYYLGDLFLLINTFIICYFYGRSPTSVALDMNHQISLLFSEATSPTFISKWAARVYIRHRPKSWVYALVTYYPETTGNSDLPLFYLPAMNWLASRVDA